MRMRSSHPSLCDEIAVECITLHLCIAGGMQVADSYSGCICGIIWPGDGLKAQQDTYHLPYLLFFSATITRHSLLDLHRCIFGNRETAVCESKHRHAACLPYCQGSARIFREEEFFHCCFVGVISCDDFAQAAIYAL